MWSQLLLTFNARFRHETDSDRQYFSRIVNVESWLETLMIMMPWLFWVMNRNILQLWRHDRFDCLLSMDWLSNWCVYRGQQRHFTRQRLRQQEMQHPNGQRADNWRTQVRNQSINILLFDVKVRPLSQLSKRNWDLQKRPKILKARLRSCM